MARHRADGGTAASGRGQMSLPFAHIRNRGLFSNHWFENRLSLEPEWGTTRDAAAEALEEVVALWKRERGRVERYGAEAPLEQAFIQPILEAIGWKLIYQTHLEGRKPDYALFATEDSKDAALSVERTSLDFWSSVVVVADAKAWHVPLNKPSVVNNQREYPPQQIEWYLDRSRRDFGILTNGGLWRLVPREYASHQRRFQTYLECDLAKLLEEWCRTSSFTARETLLDEFLQFYLFFGPAGYTATETLKPLIQRALWGSSEYRVGVGEGLKERAFQALPLCIEGFLNYQPNSLSSVDDVERCRSESFILLYRLLFIMFAEDRRLLPYRMNRNYTDNRSLGRYRDEIASRLDRIKNNEEADFSRDSTAIWEDLQSLFDLVNAGHRRYDVTEYNGGLFDSEADPFLKEKRIADYYMARVIDQLGRAVDPLHPRAGLFRVDYRDLAIQHLGGIYEGLLELQPVRASENMVVIRRRIKGRREEMYVPESDPLPNGWQVTDERVGKGKIYLKTRKGERRATGSYYTPDHIVDYIVENTLGPLCKDASEQLHREVEEVERQLATAPVNERSALQARRDELRCNYNDRILSLRILDPAMGSGHFLLRACQKLAEEIATHPYTGDEIAGEMIESESSVGYWKRRVVENCLYGVDLNALAVELAKLALWLETVASGEPLSFLDHHLRHGNSLLGGQIGRLGVLRGEILLRSDRYGEQVEAKLPALLAPLQRINEIPSDTAARIKEKSGIFREFEKTSQPFRLVGDLWCSAFCTGSTLTTEQYQKAVDELGRPRRFAAVAGEGWFQTAVAAAARDFGRCFHWEIEFPEAFFDGATRRAHAGFDVIMGNPPYDVLSELETGRSLAALMAFIDADPEYAPSRRGKNNLYKLFVCRSLELLRQGGYFGFITPMAILGDDQAADVRRRIVQVGSFTGIEAFPQKDNPAKRVFPEAKLSTAVFTIIKAASTDRPFLSRVHPAQWIAEESPGLSLTTDAIPLYDPANFTIVSCSQADWGLATRIMQTGRMQRLREFAEFFQGEVNETNERKRGTLADGPEHGTLATRGAGLCMYVVRPASQGEDLYLNVPAFLAGKDSSTKAHHFRHRRVGLQESCPQNNFRRIIAALIPSGHFCNHKVNYVPEHFSRIPLEVILALLNSKLADWYFRLGSTNAAVSHYQLYNLPFPVFVQDSDKTDKMLAGDYEPALQHKQIEVAYKVLQPNLAQSPFRLAIRDAIVSAVQKIIAIEQERGEIARTARSALDPAAQPYQDFIDRLLYRMAGLTDDEAAGLEERLARML